MPPPPIPGLSGIEHIGFVVPDVDDATRFLVDVLGGDAIYDIGPFPRHEDWMATHLAGHPRARLHRLRVIRIANGPVLELIELAPPQASPSPGHNPTSTAFHIAFYVDDMDRALVALKAHGAPIQSGPVIMTEGPSAGLTWLYFTAPWGTQFELVSYPGGIAAYRALGTRIWRPEA